MCVSNGRHDRNYLVVCFVWMFVFGLMVDARAQRDDATHTEGGAGSEMHRLDNEFESQRDGKQPSRLTWLCGMLAVSDRCAHKQSKIFRLFLVLVLFRLKVLFWHRNAMTMEWNRHLDGIPEFGPTWTGFRMFEFEANQLNWIQSLVDVRFRCMPPVEIISVRDIRYIIAPKRITSRNVNSNRSTTGNACLHLCVCVFAYARARIE